MTIKRITPFLWFNSQAEEAANYYVSLFPNSKITHVSRYGDAGPGPKAASWWRASNWVARASPPSTAARTIS